MSLLSDMMLSSNSRISGQNLSHILFKLRRYYSSRASSVCVAYVCRSRDASVGMIK